MSQIYQISIIADISETVKVIKMRFAPIDVSKIWDIVFIGELTFTPIKKIWWLGRGNNSGVVKGG